MFAVSVFVTVLKLIPHEKQKIGVGAKVQFLYSFTRMFPDLFMEVYFQENCYQNILELNE